MISVCVSLFLSVTYDLAYWWTIYFLFPVKILTGPEVNKYNGEVNLHLQRAIARPLRKKNSFYLKTNMDCGESTYPFT